MLKESLKRTKSGFLFLFILIVCSCGEQETTTIRPPAVAGSFYPQDPETLKQIVDKYLKTSPTCSPSRPLALVSPHAGYVFSGKCAARGFKLLQGKKIGRVIILAPSHYGFFHGVALPDYKFFKTPLGNVPVDTKSVSTLSTEKLFVLNNKIDDKEHSIEVQVPFLQRVLPDFQLLPLLIGSLQDHEYNEIATAILPLVDNNTLIIASSDFTHFGRRFQYTPFNNNIKNKIKKLDFQAINCILNNDQKGFTTYVKQTSATICGRKPIAVLLELLQLKFNPGHLQGVFLSYNTSASVTHTESDRLLLQNGNVSYASCAFFKTENRKGKINMDPTDLLPQDKRFDKTDQNKFLSLARSTITKYLSGDKHKDPAQFVDFDELPVEGRFKAGAFVTLHLNGRLRGCIGSIEPEQPLWEAIVSNAIHAACNDYRFNNVTKAELEKIDIEISILTPPEEVPKAEDFKVGKHGIIIEKDGRRAVFLPQVAPEQGWNREETLTNLCQKAGLPENAWQEGMRFWIYKAQVFGEK